MLRSNEGLTFYDFSATILGNSPFTDHLKKLMMKNYLETEEGILNQLRHLFMTAIWISPFMIFIVPKWFAFNCFSSTTLGIGAFCMLIGLLISLPINFMYMGKITFRDRLSQEGPFAYCRNPFYLGQTIVSIGMAICFLSIFTGICFVIYFLLTYFTIKSEEKKLLGIYGQEYQQYKKKVPRYLPDRSSIFLFLKSLFEFEKTRF